MLALVASLEVLPTRAQVIIKDSVINILPYFDKKDTMEYSIEHLSLTIVGTDTTKTKHSSEGFRVVCTKANEKKGYQIEETILSYENFIDNDDLKSKVNDIFSQIMIGSSYKYSIDANGEGLKIIDPEKAKKDMITRCNSAMDSLTKVNPLITTLLSKETIASLVEISFKIMLETSNYGQISQMFEFHGNSYPYEVRQTVDMDDDAIFSRPGITEFIAVDYPDEEDGKKGEMTNDYGLIISGVTYQDAVKAAIQNMQATTGNVISEEQLKQVLGNKMPSGEIECSEYYENSYFCDGWPKELVYKKSVGISKQSVIGHCRKA